MSAPEVAAQRLAGTALAPAGSRLVLAEWTAPGSAGDEPLYQAPLHEHPEDEAWYVLVMGTSTFALIQAIHQTGDQSPARMRQLYAAHGATLLG